MKNFPKGELFIFGGGCGIQSPVLACWPACRPRLAVFTAPAFESQLLIKNPANSPLCAELSGFFMAEGVGFGHAYLPAGKLRDPSSAPSRLRFSHHTPNKKYPPNYLFEIT